jgi:uncharacterized protein (DUF1800 family)
MKLIRTVVGSLLISSLLPTGVLPAQSREAQDETPLTETEKIRHVLSRFAFGPTPASVKAVREQGLEAWFDAQLAGNQQESAPLTDRLAGLASLDMGIRDLLLTYNKPLPPKPTLKQRRERNLQRRRPSREVRDAVIYRAVYGANQVREVASDFFRNHFNVTYDKGNVQLVVADYEREVIRGEALGSFAAMLRKSARHPAMLIYLDNALSRRPLSKAELHAVGFRTKQRTKSKQLAEESIEIAKQRGLNENYARELLELHTLGVDNYYTQRDVIEVARTLTGWTVQLNPKAKDLAVGFRFRADMHCRGEKRILGGVVKANRRDAVTEGDKVLDRLIRHKGTARFLSFKLCRYFVNDNPPEATVKRVARVFKTSKGDLPAVYRAIFKDPEFFRPRYFQAKFKRPFEFVVSALRVTGAEVRSTAGLHRVLAQLSEPVYQCEDPTGYYDQAEAWRDPGVMAVRWQFAIDLTRGRVPGVKIPRSFYQDLRRKLPKAWKDQLAPKILPAGMGEQTRRVIDTMVREHLRENNRPRRRVLGPMIAGLLLGSPEFQRQ